jgi:hypothetical protein
MGNEIKFKPATFYLEVVDHLAKAVEGLKLEDTATERDPKGGQSAKRGHGELRDDAVAPIQPERANTTAEEGMTKLPPRNDPSGKGNDKDPGSATTLGPSEPIITPEHHDEVDGVPLPTIPDVTTPTSSMILTPPQQGSELSVPRPVPRAKPYNDGRQ